MLTVKWVKRLNAKKITDRFFDAATKKYIHSQYWRMMSKYVPRQSGTLMEQVEISDDGVLYTVPYANRMYTGDNFNFRTDQNPQAQARWGGALTESEVKAISKSTAQYLNKRGSK